MGRLFRMGRQTYSPSLANLEPEKEVTKMDEFNGSPGDL